MAGFPRLPLHGSNVQFLLILFCDALEGIISRNFIGGVDMIPFRKINSNTVPLRKTRLYLFI